MDSRGSPSVDSAKGQAYAPASARVRAEKVRVLFVVNDAPFFVSHRLPLACAAQAAGFDVTVAAPDDAVAVPAIKAAGLPYVPLELSRSGTRLASEARALFGFYRLYRERRPDLVHHVAMKPVLYGSIAARLAGVPRVVNAFAGLGRLFIDSSRRASLARRAFLSTYRMFARGPGLRTIFQNEDDRELFIRAGATRGGDTVLIRGSGVDLDVFRATAEPTGSPLVVMPARMQGDKGVREFVEAARMLRAAGVDARFALVGGIDPGNPTRLSMEQLRQWAAEGTVEWWDHQRDMAGVLAKSAVVCLPSYREGLPKSLIEAAAAGRPIVTTDVPGCRDVVLEGSTGYLVPARDPVALAAALRRLIESPELRARMGAAGRALAESRFGIERVIADTLSLYNELCRDLSPWV